jgi:hypothetical protein
MSFIIPNWHKLDKNSCEMIMKEAKEYFNEVATQSEEITGRAIKIASLLGAILSFTIGLLIKERELFSGCYSFVFLACLIPHIICGYNCYKLLKVKMGRFRGIQTTEWDYEAITDDENKEFIYQTAFMSAMQIIQANSERMTVLNNDRYTNYSKALAFVFISIISSGIVAGFTLTF